MSSVIALALLSQGGLVIAIGAAPNAVVWSPRSEAVVKERFTPHGLSVIHSRQVTAGGDLVAWVLEPRPRDVAGTIVLLHGVRMDKQSSIPMALALCEAGYRAVLVDLPGHGESEGLTLSYGEREAREVSALLDTLSASKMALGPVGAYGFSYGAAVAIDWAAVDPRVRSVVAVSPFASLREVIRDYRYEYLPAVTRAVPDSWFQSAVTAAAWVVGFDADGSAPVRKIRATSAATLLIHGDADTQIPLRHSRELLGSAPGRAELHVVHGGTHDSMPADPTHAVRTRAVAWFDATVRAPLGG